VQKSSGKLYWYGMGSDPLDETDAAGNTNNASFNEYVFFNGRRIARRDSLSNVFYYFADHLGTARLVTNSSGAVLDDSDFYPFGGERVVASSSGNHYKFTGKERDQESGLDNFGARYDSSSLGRFMSVDPSRESANPVNPQSWNRYAYAFNNPLTYVDRNGLWPTYIHNEIFESIFSHHLSPRQIQLIERVSASQDSLIPGQLAKNANWHGQCSPGQGAAACSTGIANHINTNLAAAKKLGDAEGLSDAAFTYYAIAAHTLADKGSPSHTEPDGTPTTWFGLSPWHALADIAHVWEERDEWQAWYGYGQSVRNDTNAFFFAFREDANSLFDGESANQVANSAIESVVNAHLSIAPMQSPIEEDALRQCALGNPAACD
jgi:RHS repeat-associated protein